MQVYSSLSGIPFYAPSAGFAPTNSADVSAIASAYQVVSATATQLYAGTAYVTSVNDNPLSASRAGNAANASLANSAWYDGTGRLISALPDSATVSAIASSYAESAASSKQDTLTFGYDTANNISSIDGSAIGGQGGGGGIDSATCSAIASSYAESAVSSKADSSALSSYVPYSGLEYNTASAISGINGSALAAGSTYSAGEGINITDDVISVETPVDIVAGPGIVVDNPDGNTLRVSTDENYETVLFSTDTPPSSGTINLSESVFNFTKIGISFRDDGDGTYYGVNYQEFPCVSSSQKFAIMGWDYHNTGLFAKWATFTVNSAGTTLTCVRAGYSDIYGAGKGQSDTSYQWAKPFKIVGIHRIQGDN